MKFYRADNKVIAVSKYAGKTVKGVAKCNPEDEFDWETGKKLAEARCNIKIAAKRYKRACERLSEADEKLAEMQNYNEKMYDYWVDTKNAYKDTQDEMIMVKQDIAVEAERNLEQKRAEAGVSA